MRTLSDPYNLILNDFKLEDSNVLAVFPYGSRVYGTNREDSDYDFIVVCKSVETDSDQLDSKFNPISITVYSEESFTNQVVSHKIKALECLSLPDNLLIKNLLSIKFKLNKPTLRHSISEKVSKDWVQAKKRFIDSANQGINSITGQQYIQKIYEGKKSLFHCFRMVDFATQIVQHNKIINFSSCNELWEELYTNPSENWQDYNDLYHTKYNAMMTEFRKIAPKV